LFIRHAERRHHNTEDRSNKGRGDDIRDRARSINKWQGGVLSNVDDCFYAVPADTDCVLRVNTHRGDNADSMSTSSF